MNEDIQKNKPEFETDFRYAIVAGWLIIPALMILINLLTVMEIAFHFNPVYLRGYDLFLYTINLILAFFYLLIIYKWIKRKRILTKLMVASFTIEILLNFPLAFAGIKANWIHILFSLIWIGYFIRSRRVKATFLN